MQFCSGCINGLNIATSKEIVKPLFSYDIEHTILSHGVDRIEQLCYILKSAGQKRIYLYGFYF